MHSNWEYDVDMLWEPTALRSSLGWVDQGRLPGGGDACPDPEKLTRQRRSVYGWWPGQRAACQEKEGREFNDFGNHSN